VIGKASQRADLSWLFRLEVPKTVQFLYFAPKKERKNPDFHPRSTVFIAIPVLRTILPSDFVVYKFQEISIPTDSDVQKSPRRRFYYDKLNMYRINKDSHNIDK
jgi:hypothetical protein